MLDVRGHGAPRGSSPACLDRFEDRFVIVPVQRVEFTDLGGGPPDVVLRKEALEVVHRPTEPAVAGHRPDALVERVVGRPHAAIEGSRLATFEIRVERRGEGLLGLPDLLQIVAAPTDGCEPCSKALEIRPELVDLDQLPA